MGILAGLQYKFKENSYLSDATFIALSGLRANSASWTDVTDETEFNANVLLRVKPIYYWHIQQFNANGSIIDTQFTDKDKLMSHIAGEITGGKSVNVKTLERSSSSVGSFLRDKNIQWRSSKIQGWSYGRDFDATSHNGYPLYFRTRPDYSYEVTTSLGITSSSQFFDDVDILMEYVNRMVRTESASSVSLSRVKN